MNNATTNALSPIEVSWTNEHGTRERLRLASVPTLSELRYMATQRDADLTVYSYDTGRDLLHVTPYGVTS